MTNWKSVGTYLSRTVSVADISAKQPFEVKELKNSVVLVVLGSTISSNVVLALLKGLVCQSPLAIVLSGANARAAFDALISELCAGGNGPHIMTGLSEETAVESAIERFLQATWPSEERFEDWKAYAILNVEGDARRIEQAVSRICNQ